MATKIAAPDAELVDLLASFVALKSGGLRVGSPVPPAVQFDRQWADLDIGRKRSLVALVDRFDRNGAAERRRVPAFDRLVTYTIRAAGC